MPEPLLAAGRSFVLALATLLITSLLVALDCIGDGVYSAIVIGTVGAYIVRSIAQDFKPGTP